MVDLGCGNAYLTFAAHRYLTAVRGLPVHTTGVDVKAQSREHNTQVAERARPRRVDERSCRATSARPSCRCARTSCSRCTPATPPPTTPWPGPSPGTPRWCWPPPAATTTSRPSCGSTPTPAPYTLLTRSGILRERFADTLTDAMRAAILRLAGYRVDVIEFVDSKHTPRNTLLRAVRTGAAPGDGARAELDELTRTWGVHPKLAELLRDRLA